VADGVIAVKVLSFNPIIMLAAELFWIINSLRLGLAAKITVLVAVAIVGQVVTRAPE
jgi:hypothetical protein